MFVDSTGNNDYTYATAEFSTGDSAIGLIVEYYAPKYVVYSGYIIQKLRFWNRTEMPLTGVAAGEVLDWDVPSYEHDSENFPGKDSTRFLLYQSCSGDDRHDQCDTLQSCDRYAGVAATLAANPDLDILGFKNYLVLENDVFVYESPIPPALAGNPLDPDSLYSLMTGKTGYWWKNYPNNPFDTGENLSTVVTFDVYDLNPHDTLCVVSILATSKNDAQSTGLKNSIDLANDFIHGHDDIKCPWTTCCDLPGDANDDAGVSIGAPVYLINYIFKGGPPPPCLNEGDTNADCFINIGDVVHMINYIFKSGPRPLCGCVGC